jgi:MFS family permease
MQLWMFLITAFLNGAAGAFFTPASSALLPATVAPERLQEANALLGISQSAGTVLGPAVSGVIVAAAGPAWVFAIDAATFLASGAFLVAIRVEEVLRTVRQRFLRELGEGWEEVWHRDWLRIGFVSFSINNFAIGSVFVLGPLVAKRDLGGAASWGIVLTVAAVGGVLGSAAAFRLRPQRPLVAAFVVWSWTGLPLLAFAKPAALAVCAVAMALFYFSVSFANPLWESLLQREVRSDRLSRVIAFDWMVSLVFMPIGQAVSGPLANAIGTRKTLLAAAALSAAANAVPLLTRPIRERR